ncbi:MAG: hypothetical protein FWH45_00065 [Methanomassiliicoccaceae archaeon]|nr:hypothetical protein [Methanomassiliicoccaceae archaeon]MCL2145569.1 hypothetical protein [Methanomassiliicoccaceae archaeon]
MKIFDRYSLLCISVSFIILAAVFVDRGEPEDNSIVGIAYEIKETQNGFTFFLEDSRGGKMKCFSRTEPTEYFVYSIKGTASDDGSIFFVNSMRIVSE